MNKIEQFAKRFRVSKKEPDWALFSLVVPAALVKFRVEGVEVFAVKAVGAFFDSLGRWAECPSALYLFVKGGVDAIIILAVEMAAHLTQRFTNLTKSKRCPKTLDT